MIERKVSESDELEIEVDQIDGYVHAYLIRLRGITKASGTTPPLLVIPFDFFESPSVRAAFMELLSEIGSLIEERADLGDTYATTTARPPPTKH